MYEVLDDVTAQILLTIESGDSIHRVAQHLQRPYETVRQAVNRLEESGYVDYHDGLSVVDSRVRTAACDLVTASASVSPQSIEEAYIIPAVWRVTVRLHSDRRSLRVDTRWVPG